MFYKLLMPRDQTTNLNKTSASMYSVVLLPTQDHYHLTNACHTIFFPKDLFSSLPSWPLDSHTQLAIYNIFIPSHSKTAHLLLMILFTTAGPHDPSLSSTQNVSKMVLQPTFLKYYLFLTKSV